MKASLFTILIAPLAVGAEFAPGSDVKRSFAVTAQNLSAYETSSSGGQRFTLGEIQNDRYQQPDTPSALVRAHTKYGSSMPPRLKQAVEANPDLNSKFKAVLQSDEKGSVPAYPAPYFDSQYVVPMKIGTPPQTTYLNLDTGSSDLWTFSSGTFPPEANGHTLYRPEDSKTSKLLEGATWMVHYGDGAGAGGVVFKDRVQVGETSFDHQAVQAAVEVSFAISSDPFSSGILGMASSGANTVRPTPQKTYLDNIKDNLSLPIFTADLRKGQAGSYNFGYIDKKLFNGDIQFTPIDLSAPYWKILVEGYQIGHNGSYQSFDWESIVDTGTSLLLAPDQIVDQYYSEVEGAAFDPYQGMVVFPCDAEMPDFVFGLDNYRGVVPGHYINYSQANATHCYGGIQTSAGIGFSVLGDILLKAQFVVFDAGALVVGFANKDTEPPES